MSNFVNKEYLEKLQEMSKTLPEVSIVNMSPFFMSRVCRYYSNEILEKAIELINFMGQHEQLCSTYIINRGIMLDEIKDRKYFYYMSLKQVSPDLTRFTKN